jgi:hypothetical protein
MIETNPGAIIPNPIPTNKGSENAHSRVWTDGEIQDFWRSLQQSGIKKPPGFLKRGGELIQLGVNKLREKVFEKMKPFDELLRGSIVLGLAEEIENQYNKAGEQIPEDMLDRLAEGKKAAVEVLLHSLLPDEVAKALGGESGMTTATIDGKPVVADIINPGEQK